MNMSVLYDLAVLVPIFIVSIALHELAHAATADALGDPTPREQGRLTFNPLAHLDLFGTLMLFIAHFGWAKPVPFKPWLLRWPRLGTFLVAAAGPTTNFALAIAALSAWKFLHVTGPATNWLGTVAYLNITLTVLNFLPLPPLDGGHLLESLIPRSWLPTYEHLTPYAMVLMLILVLGPFPLLSILFHMANNLVFGWFGIY